MIENKLSRRNFWLFTEQGANIYYRVSNLKVNHACNLMREVLLEQLEEGRKIVRKFSVKR